METENNTSSVNFVPCLRWVKRGAASPNPAKVQLSKNELVEIIKDTKHKLRVTDNRTGSEDVAIEDASDEFNFESYDNDDESAAQTLGIHTLAELETEAEEHFSESDDSEREDDVFKPNDNLILVGHVEGDASILEVYVYNAEEEALYVHHDIFLPAFPLCLEWSNFEPNQPKGNYCAVGSMSPVIEVWDVDIINGVRPAFTLGKMANKKKKRDHVGHTDAVLALAWNKMYEHVMASGSVDQTIILWDMENLAPSSTIDAFNDKVQCLEWHKFEGQTLLAGGCDKKAKVFDCRTPEEHQTWTLDGEAERLAWNPLQPFSFLAGTSGGSVECFDCRKGKLWGVPAHNKEVTGLTVSDQCPGLLVTASPDELVKIWDIYEGQEPKLVFEKVFSMGNLHCVELCPDSPFVISLGGDKKSNNFTVFDLRNIDEVTNTFGSRTLIRLEPDAETQ
ncbi:periodic tryptophan protein 1 homolog [Cylas formicarius]|uniref:periodic tryptophan protein 1 homolog n=1 Tax=Cylas formicarius TaxID=197179 RepID=UPI0029583BDC|nr:periodic tryptophan protein 1 homolog [Cylas formicarius]